MSAILDTFPIAVLALVVLIPVVYCLAWRRGNLKKTTALWLVSMLIVLLYPIVTYASEQAGDLGYFMAKIP